MSSSLLALVLAALFSSARLAKTTDALTRL
jgi:hypothetical protein